jgi:probable phosphoglycerate mutase
VLVEVGDSIGVATNNVAEYSGLVAGLTAAADLGAVEVEVRMDSRLVVEQMSGRWQIRNPGLRPLAAKAAALVGRFESVRFAWVPREQNVAADALANAAMDASAAGQRDAAATSPDPDVDETTRRPSWTPRPAAGAARLVLVRHGQTSRTVQRRYSGRADVELSPQGRAEADAVAARVGRLAVAHAATVADPHGAAPAGQVPASVVVTSPLTRCQDTARVIAAGLGGAPVSVDDAFVECDFGAWEGLTADEIRRDWASQLDAWLASTTVAPPGGESFVAVDARVRPAVARLAAANVGRFVVVVSHVTPIKLVLRNALAATDALLHRLYLDPAGISVVDVWPDGGTAVRSVNDTAHLA